MLTIDQVSGRGELVDRPLVDDMDLQAAIAGV